MLSFNNVIRFALLIAVLCAVTERIVIYMNERFMKCTTGVGLALTIVASLIVSGTAYKHRHSLPSDVSPSDTYISPSDVLVSEPDDSRQTTEPEPPEPDEPGKTTLARLQQKFPHGKYWNHVGGSNYPDGYTDVPCPDHDNCSYFPDGCSCNSFLDAIQCRGFVMKLAYDYYGSSIRNWTKVKDLKSLKPGDAICYRNGVHTIWVTDVKGSTITFADCNGSGRCRIRWNQTIKKSSIKNIKYVYVAPKKLDEADKENSASTPQTVDDKYAKEFKAEVKYKMSILDAEHKPIGNVYVEKGETCTVHEVYTDGFCRIAYSADETGTEAEGYCYLADFNSKSIKKALVG